MRGVDWKKLEYRANKFSSLLHEMAQHQSFHGLPCLGFVKNEDTIRYGYVFDLSASGIPAACQAPLSPPVSRKTALPCFATLHDLLCNPCLQPSLNTRVSYAIDLLETVLQLHTAGWLHKEIRSHNIIFVSQSPECVSDQDLIRSPLHVVGYAYARKDDQYDFTEPLESESEADLYRHPSSSLGNLRQPYCKCFDIFSVGCLLLELGLWTTLSDILGNYIITPFAPAARPGPRTATSWTPLHTPPHSPRSSKEDLEVKKPPDYQHLQREMLAQFRKSTSRPGTVIELLASRAGRVYCEIVRECLTVKTDGWETTGPSQAGDRIKQEENGYALDLEKRALDCLRGLAERL